MKFLFYASAALAGLSFAFAKTHDVTVGPNGKLVYEPPFIHANKGDIVKFTFKPKNHTVTESSFNHPCTKFGHPGFDSGFQPIDPKHPKDKFVRFKVPSKEPLWFYCRQKVPVSHCGKGMVFAINPPKKGNTFDKFKKKALATAK